MGVLRRAADRAEEDAVAGAGEAHLFVADRRAVRLDTGDADLPDLEGEGVAEPLADRVQHLARLGHHLRADAVAGQTEDVVLRHAVASAACRADSAAILLRIELIRPPALMISMIAGG